MENPLFRRTLILTVVALALAISASTAAPAAPAARVSAVADCSVWVWEGYARVTSARNVRCGLAARDLSHYGGRVRSRFTTPGGYTCRVTVMGASGGEWRCTSGARAYRFDYAG
jgi:hypothetical protein